MQTTVEERSELHVPDTQHRRINVGELTLHVVEAGQGPLVILLHGFPEFWWSWRRQIPALVAAGYHVVVPDMRGYGGSDKPPSAAAYRMERLTSDVAGLVRALGGDRAIIVGHDWGAQVAWETAMAHPALVERLAILNVPHPVVMAEGLRRPRQMKKSWYMFFYQLPSWPEQYLRKNDYENIRRMFRADGMDEAEIDQYVQAAKEPGALTGAVNYYRAAIRDVVLGRLPPRNRIDVPVLVIWGERDRFLGRELATPPPKLVPNARIEFLPDASHWVQQSAPAKVNELLLRFLNDR